eukprot:TRINITY_DN75510_c0_g1_i1.p1 TRINITY_DN75510_c0_g1~~TRINITY_DN75510_c0_g1_i1.p1  ORF type:complete len:362 (+),score=45.70 TRINITY_DN75510_c0_g1_i1:83-1087(+)
MVNDIGSGPYAAHDNYYEQYGYGAAAPPQHPSGGRILPQYEARIDEAPKKPGSGHSIFRSGALMNEASFTNLAELILIPWIILVIVLITFFFSGDHQEMAMILVPSVIIFLSAVFTYNRYYSGNAVEVVLGVLILVAVIAGVIIGGYANATAMKEYWRLGRGASYFNVFSDELAGGKSDATTLVFAPGSRVDSGRTYGFTDGHSREGTLYCVAPVSAGNSAEMRVQFWAAGVDCCYPRSNFHCGQATNEEATGAVVLSPNVRSNPNFKKAIDGAEAAYGLQAGDDYLLVDFVNDPVGHREVLRTTARNLMLIFGAVYLVISVMTGCVLMPVLKP